MASVVAAVGGEQPSLLLGRYPLTLEEIPNGRAGLCTNAQPILDPLSLQRDFRIIVLGIGIVPPQLFDDAPVARAAGVHCVEAEEAAMPPAKPF